MDVIYSDSVTKCLISLNSMDNDILKCNLTEAWLYSISAGTWCRGCPGNRMKTLAQLRETGVIQESVHSVSKHTDNHTSVPLLNAHTFDGNTH